ncbi:ubiquitin-like modifier 1 [Calocera viscosa TUFC12733]|uniref:Ubiquitin-related modifier 1 n=1 Tax=Calocera viscosa (strain TUFC12733) TaxID=1330018 RepID=A0A167KIW1_CALVF|nr:ubiquitin-like modifier 1 [Calocera viscosa TUFC12733]
MEDEKTITVKLVFGGGVEVLFSNKRNQSITIPAQAPASGSHPSRPADLRYLILWMSESLLTDRKELFVDGETVRPGILVLVNDTDWELEGELDYELQKGDEVVFISTLHGG